MDHNHIRVCGLTRVDTEAHEVLTPWLWSNHSSSRHSLLGPTPQRSFSFSMFRSYVLSVEVETGAIASLVQSKIGQPGEKLINSFSFQPGRKKQLPAIRSITITTKGMQFPFSFVATICTTQMIEREVKIEPEFYERVRRETRQNGRIIYERCQVSANTGIQIPSRTRPLPISLTRTEVARQYERSHLCSLLCWLAA